MIATGELLPLGQELVQMPAPSRRVRCVAGDVAIGARRIQNGFDPCGFGDRLPDRLQDGQDGLCVHFVNRQASPPLRLVLFVAPLGSLGIKKLVRALAERWVPGRSVSDFPAMLG
jgi:hypothetical protein